MTCMFVLSGRVELTVMHGGVKNNYEHNVVVMNLPLCPQTAPGGYFQIRRSWGGRLGPHIKFGGKIWGKVRPSSQNRRKNLGSSVTKRRKSWGKVPILGSYLKFRGQNLGYLSFIFLEAKFGAPTRISEAKFGAKPPDLLIWKYPPGQTADDVKSGK